MNGFVVSPLRTEKINKTNKQSGNKSLLYIEISRTLRAATLHTHFMCTWRWLFGAILAHDLHRYGYFMEMFHFIRDGNAIYFI